MPSSPTFLSMCVYPVGPQCHIHPCSYCVCAYVVSLITLASHFCPCFSCLLILLYIGVRIVMFTHALAIFALYDACLSLQYIIHISRYSSFNLLRTDLILNHFRHSKHVLPYYNLLRNGLVLNHFETFNCVFTLHLTFSLIIVDHSSFIFHISFVSLSKSYRVYVLLHGLKPLLHISLSTRPGNVYSVLQLTRCLSVLILLVAFSLTTAGPDSKSMYFTRGSCCTVLFQDIQKIRTNTTPYF